MKTQSKVQALLAQPSKKSERTKSSFCLDKNLFDGFRSLCEERGITQSDMLDAMLADLLEMSKTGPGRTVSGEK